MSQQANTSPMAVIADPLEFARDERCLDGVIPVAELERLRDLLVVTTGAVQWQVRGRVEQGLAGGSRAFLDLEVQGELQLLCQRCLGPRAFVVQIASCLELIAPGGTWPEDELEDDTCDAIEAERDLSLASLVEDEILLALPTSPRHDVCQPPVRTERSDEASPFAALAALKKSP